MTLSRRLAAEAPGTAFLLATVIGSPAAVMRWLWRDVPADKTAA